MASQECTRSEYEGSDNENAHTDVWHTRKERIMNKVIYDKVRVASIGDKIRKTRLRWFIHVKRKVCGYTSKELCGYTSKEV